MDHKPIHVEDLPPRALARLLKGTQAERESWKRWCLEAEKTAGQALGLLDEARRMLFNGGSDEYDLAQKIDAAFPHFRERE